jgi:regulator of protease activity HflC (stomatin/prohibitin superfamily)
VKAENSVYRINDIDQAIKTTVTGVVRSVIGKTDLDGVQSNRRLITQAIEEELRAVTEEWGIVLSRVEIVDVEVDDETRSAMQLQLNAERNRRAVVRQAEGEREAAQLKADADLYTAQKQAEAQICCSPSDKSMKARVNPRWCNCNSLSNHVKSILAEKLINLEKNDHRPNIK